MKIVTAILLSLFTLVFFSCQKEFSGTIDNTTIDTTITTTLSNKIKTYTEDITQVGIRTVTTFNINYDAVNRIISLVSAASPGDKVLYQYNTNNTFTMDLFNSNELIIHEIVFMNGSSHIDSSFQYNNTGDTTTEKYLYNAANQLIKSKEYAFTTPTGGVLSNTHIYSYDNMGNQISDKDDFSLTTYDYTNRVSNISFFPFYLNMPPNLIETTTITSGGSTDIIDHTYTFDSGNRLSTEKQEVNGGDVLIKTYTYY